MKAIHLQIVALAGLLVGASAAQAQETESHGRNLVLSCAAPQQPVSN